MPSTDRTQPGPGETVIRRTTTRFSNKIPWLPLLAAIVGIPLLLAASATFTGLGERDPIESGLTDRTEQALGDAGIDNASVAFDGRDATIGGVPAGLEDAAHDAVDGVDGVRTADIATSDGDADSGDPDSGDGEPPEMGKQELQTEIDKTLAEGVTFRPRSAELTSESDEVLRAVAELVQQVPDAELAVEGHSQPPDNKNRQQLSTKRAEAVKARLGELGVSADRITTEGFGGTEPLSDSDSPDGQASNRRVEINVL